MRSTSVRARPARLDPVGRVRLPRRTTMLRLAFVAALLLTAAGLLYSGGGSGDGSGDAGSPAKPATAGTAPAATGPAWPAGAEPDPLAIPDGMVGVPVPLAEPAALAVLHPGDRVDLLSVPATGGAPVPVAGDAAVLAVDRAGGSVLLALTEERARAALSAPAGSRFAVVVRS